MSVLRCCEWGFVAYNNSATVGEMIVATRL
jgi:hypothetical protein